MTETGTICCFCPKKDCPFVQIVLDVHDFMEGDIKVQVLDEEELLIEGQTSCHSFRRTFTLPDQANLDAITSFISLDGIMTVTVPRLVSAICHTEYLVLPE